MMEEKTIGGISYADVIAFQLRIMFGENNFTRIKEAQDEKEIILACLRLASNDAFRHVTLNRFSTEAETKKFVTAQECATLDQYIFEKVLPKLYEVYLEYVRCKSTEEKCKTLENSITKLCNAYKDIKVIEDSDKALCFGHFQKMFNMATKNYLCVYMCREQLKQVFGKELPIGSDITEQDMAYADCPIDSYILSALDSDTQNSSTEKPAGIKRFSDMKWSKLGSVQPTCQYNAVQDAVADQCPNGASKLWYDFKRWNIR